MMSLYNNLKQSLNQRTLYALILLGFTLGFVLVARIDDASVGAKDLRIRADERLARQGGGVDEEVWRKRADYAQLALSNWQATRWSGPTAGVVSAELQSSLNKIATTAQLDVVSVTVEPSPEEGQHGDVLRFRFTTESQSGDRVAQALAAMAAHKPMIFADTINVVFDDQKTGRFSVAGFAPITIASPAQADS